MITLLAVSGKSVLGQINVFGIRAGAELANVGYHVHPYWQGRGIGATLPREAVARVGDRLQDGLVAQTDRANRPSWRLAEEVGFRAASDDVVRKHGAALKVLADPEGLCLHLSRVGSGL